MTTPTSGCICSSPPVFNLLLITGDSQAQNILKDFLEIVFPSSNISFQQCLFFSQYASLKLLHNNGLFISYHFICFCTFSEEVLIFCLMHCIALLGRFSYVKKLRIVTSVWEKHQKKGLGTRNKDRFHLYARSDRVGWGFFSMW